MHKLLVTASFLAACYLFSDRASAQYPGQYQQRQKISVAPGMKAQGFNLEDVRLLDSRFRQNMLRDGAWLLRINSARLLHSWRVNAGLPTDARPLGGWEALDCELRGHTMGHVLSGLSLMYASTGDPAFKHKADSLVSALSECQQALGQDGYLSAFPQHLIDRVIDNKPVWAPWYTLHKVMAGLTDAYLYTGNDQALQVAEKMSGWAFGRLSKLSPDQLAQMERNEFGGMIEVAYNLYAITGNKNDQKLAALFYHHSVLDPLAEKQDKLAGLHANTQIPKIIGEARGYELTGDEKARNIADFFWQTVIHHHTYAIGGNSDDEHFFSPDQLSKHLSAVTTETCNTYNMLKLTRHLFAWTGDARYADYYEQALYNHILGSQDSATGMFTYFMCLKPGLFKVYSTPENSFWCCVGTGFESQAKFGEGIYYHDDKGVYVNLFIPSELTWNEKGFQLKQETRYPEEAATHLTIEKTTNPHTQLYIRYPSWATSGASCTINGKPVRIAAVPGSYIRLDRDWKTGDKIDISYPMSLRWIPTNDNPQKAAIAYGPIVLAGDLGLQGIKDPAPFARDQKDYVGYDSLPDLSTALPVKGRHPGEWLKPVKDRPLVFKSDLPEKAITLIPYYRTDRDRYILYWDLQ